MLWTVEKYYCKDDMIQTGLTKCVSKYKNVSKTQYSDARNVILWLLGK